MWLKSVCIFLTLAGFGSCASFLYMAHINENFPYPNGDMSEAENAAADAVINRTVRNQQRLALFGATTGVCAAVALVVIHRGRKA